MAQVFISHSKDDEVGKNFFKSLFQSVEHKAYWYSWEGPKPPHAHTLREAILSSASVFVVLSKQMEYPHTRIWVGYEVGIASALKLNVWVFEPSNEICNVPVPYVTGYLKFPQSIQNKNTYPFIEIVESAGKSTEICKNPPYTLLEFSMPPQLVHIRCSNDNCSAEYYIRETLKDSIHCPVCRNKTKVIITPHKHKK